MRAVCQRVSRAQVRVDGRTVGQIGSGFCVLLGVARGDGIEDAGRLAGKVARLRVFPEEACRFDRSVLEQLTCECYGAIRKTYQRLLPEG